MKILPVINYNIHLLPVQKQQQFRRESTLSTSFLSAGTFYTCPVNFAGASNNLQVQLLNLDGVHCPCCGEAMISTSKTGEILKKASRAKSLTDYAGILVQNKEYFHKKYHPLINSINGLAKKAPEKTIPEALQIVRNGSFKIVIGAMHKQGHYLNELLETEKLSASDQIKIKSFADYLNNITLIPKKKEYDEKFHETFDNLDSADKKKFAYLVNNSIMSAYNCRGVLFYDKEQLNGLSPQTFIVKRMLDFSQNTLKKIFINRPDNNGGNNILICGECAPRYKTFNFIRNAPYAKERLEQYAQDISNAINENKLSGNNGYIYDFIKAVNVPGKNLLKMSNVSGITQSKIFYERKRNYIFEQYEGIPCASCGIETITHDQKVKLFNEIKKCENVYELKNLVKINENHIPSDFRKLVKRFNAIIDKNPDISESEVMEYLQKAGKEDLSKHMLKVCEKIKTFVDNNNFNFVEKEIINDFIFWVKQECVDMPYGQEFHYSNYNKMIEDTLGTLHNSNRAKLIDMAKTRLKEVYMEDYILHPPAELAKQAGGILKSMMQNVFKLTVITVDHTEALAAGGADEYFNKTGYCKFCNIQKGKKPLEVWAAQHPEINKNLPKHLKYISGIIKREHMKEMYDYPEKAARQAIRLARGKIHIPTDYDTRD